MRVLIACWTLGGDVASHAACLPIPSGLVSWWSGDDNGYDLNGFNHGALRFGASYTNGKVGRAFRFDGTSNLVQTTTWGMNVGTLDFSIVGWAKTTSTKSKNALLMFDFYSPALYITDLNGGLQLFPAPGTTSGGFNDGVFHHFAVTRLNGGIHYYKDGVLMGTTVYTANISEPRFLIGSDTIQPFQGAIDEVAFFNRALTAGEVQSIFAAGAEGMCKPIPPSLPFFIEAEDFDFNGGQHLAIADAMPYLGGLYANWSAIAEIDYHDPGSNENAAYRPPSQAVAISGSADLYRDGYSLTANYKIGWNDAGDWYNYTRVFPSPARGYNIYARLSGGNSSVPTAIQLDEVVSGEGSTNQTVVRIGRAGGPPSGSWDYFYYYPVLDASGSPVTITWGGEKTVRLTVLAGGQEDINFLEFVPVDPPSINACVASPPGLVAWWSGDGHPRDLQGGQHGTLRNGTTYAAGKAGEGFVFDGVDDYVETALDVQPSAMPTATWECWVLPGVADPARRQILGCDDGGYDRTVGIESSTFTVFVGSGVWYPIGITPNRWQHIAVVYTPTNVVFYKNGVAFYYNAAPTGGTTANRLQIGRNPGFGEHFEGRIDEVGIYNRAISAAEIQSIYNNGSAGRCKPIVCPNLTTSPSSLSNAIVGSDYSQTFTALGGAAPYTFSLSRGLLPPALVLSSNGVLSGTLTSTGQFSFGLRVMDNNGCTAPVSNLLAVVPRPLPCTNLPAGLVSWWRAEGNAEDATGLSGTALLNGTKFAPGKVGQAFNFDGSASYLTVPAQGLNIGTGDFTLEGWIKTSSTRDYQTICSFDTYNPAIYVQGSGTLQIYPFTPSTNVFNDGQFHHFAVVRASGRVTYYKDGAADITVAVGVALNAQNVYLGWDRYGSDLFPGLIDELSFYNRALTAGELGQIFGAGSNGKCGDGAGGGVPNIGISPVNLDFGTNLLGQLGSSLGLTVNNRGTATVTLNTSAFSDPQFSLPPGTLPLSLGAGEQKSILVVFAPTRGGPQSGTLTLNSSGQVAGTVMLAAQAITNSTPQPIVAAWGGNANGQIGDGTRTARPRPVLVNTGGVLMGKRITSVSAGAADSFAVSDDGQVFAWGANSFGQLGNHANADVSLAVAVDMTGALNGRRIVSVVAGPEHTLALTADGRAFAWGRNNYDKLGDGTYNTTNAAVAVDTSGALAGKFLTAGAVGSDFSLVLAGDGRVYGWGDNLYGQLGARLIPFSSDLPVAVVTHGALAGRPVIKISAGGSHTLALTADGQIFAWGNNNYGQLGIGLGVDSTNEPVAVVTNGTLAGRPVIAVAAGGNHSLALTADGQVFAWGYGYEGQLGNGVSTATNAPVAVNLNGLAGRKVIGIQAGSGFGAARTSDGRMYMWGEGDRLGNGSPANSLLPLPVDMTGVLTNEGVIAMAGRSNHIVVLAVGATNAASDCVTTGGGLLAWYPGENAATDSQGSLPGTLENGATFAAGKVGQAFSFDGIDDDVLLPTLNAGSQFTVELWFYPTSLDRFQHLVSDQSGSATFGALYWDRDGPSFYHANSRIFSFALPFVGLNNWMHMALTYDSSALTIYVNGQSYATNTGTSLTLNNPLKLGYALVGSDTHFKGLMDEVAIYNRALNAGEVTAIFNAGSLGKCSGSNPDGTNVLGSCTAAPSRLVSWWKSENSPDDARALNNGVWHGAASYAAGKVGQGFNFGTSNYVESPMNGMTVGIGDYSVEGWIKPAQGVNHAQTIISFGGSSFPGLYVEANGLLRLRGANTAPAGTAVNDGAFHHVAVVRQASGISYFKDGANIGRVDNASSADLSVDRCYVGWDLNSFSFFPTVFQGVIDELSFYRRALSSNEISALFAAGADGKCAIISSVLEVTPTALDFGYVAVGQGNNLTLTVSNSGNTPLVLSNIVASNPQFTLVSPAVPLTVATGAQQVVTVRFTPPAPGLQMGSFALSNNSAHGTFYLPVRGIGSTVARPRGGLAYAWGEVPGGKLGHGLDYAYSSSVPVRVATTDVLAGKTIVAVAGGYSHSLALDSDGRVYTWGNGKSGQLGNGAKLDSSVPVAVAMSGALAGKIVTAVAAGDRHSVVLTADGRVFTWGSNGSGALGAGGLSDSTVPVPVDMVGDLAGKKVGAIAASGRTTLALASDGRVYGWGGNFFGQLGNGTNLDSRVPVAVDLRGVLAGKLIIAIAQGGGHSLALAADGKVYSWGDNRRGQLGNNTFNESRVPVAVDIGGVLSGKIVVAIAAGSGQSVALTTDGRVFDWGNDEGALGAGTSGSLNSAVPVAVTTDGALAGRLVVGIASADQRSMALLSDGKVFAWGDNRLGILGAGFSRRTLPETNAPTAIYTRGLLDRQAVSAIAAADYHSLVIAAPDPAIVAPAIELVLPPLSLGQVAPGQTRDVSVIVKNTGTAPLVVNAVSNTNPRFTILSSNPFTLAPGAANSINVRFAPTNIAPQLNVLHILSNDADKPALFVPMNAAGAPTGSVAIAWGDNSKGQVGIGLTNTPISMPVAVRNDGGLAGKSIVMLAGGGNHTVALSVDGNVYTWGRNNSGQLGNGTRSVSPPFGSNAPVAVNLSGAMAGKAIISVAAGADFSAALSTEGQVFVWGENNSGQLGNGTVTPFAEGGSTLPVPVNINGALAGRRVIAIACGGTHMLALSAEGKVFAWGSSDHGELGTGSYEAGLVPVAVDGAVDGLVFNQTMVAIAAGDAHNLALGADGTVYAWGIENDGVLGIASEDYIPVPVTPDPIFALAGKRVVAISAGESHNLALTSDGLLAAWGGNASGQLGTGLADEFGYVPTATNLPVAVKMTGALVGKSVVAIHAGRRDSSLALTADGQVFTWGANDFGQLGIGGSCPTCDTNEPVAVNSAALTGMQALSLGAGGTHGLAVAFPSALFTNALPDIDVTPTNLFFGTITVGQTNQLSLTISNIGGVTLTVSSMIISNAATFSFIAASLPFNLNPGEETTIAVQFRPGAVESHSGSLTIGSNDPDEASVVIPLSGTSTRSSVPNLVVAPVILNFGMISVGQTNSLTVAVTNAGSASLAITSMTMNHSFFTLAGNPAPATLLPGAGMVLRIRFHPYADGIFNDTLTIGSNDPDEPTRTVALTGRTAPARLAAFGYNSDGQFGDGNANNFAFVPISIPLTGALAGKTIVSIESSGRHVLALTSEGKVFGWGYNFFGQVGDGGTDTRLAPVAISGGALAGKTVAAIAVGGFHSVALTSDGEVLGWGDNGAGQIGDGSTTSRSRPTAVYTAGALNGTRVTAIAAGSIHTLALTSDGRVYAWGGNGGGQLENWLFPVTIDPGGVLSDKSVVAISAGGVRSLALSSEGKAYAWGGAGAAAPVPVVTSGALKGKFLSDIAEGGNFSIGLASDGTVFTWGQNSFGELGNGSGVASSAVPVAVNMNGALNGKRVLAVSAGFSHALVIASDGRAYGWGANAEGQLGYGETVFNTNAPVAVYWNGVLAGQTIAAIAAGYPESLVVVGPPPAIPVHRFIRVEHSGSTVTLTWPAALDVHLETTTELTPDSWSRSADQPIRAGENWQITIIPSQAVRFFRLAPGP